MSDVSIISQGTDQRCLWYRCVDYTLISTVLQDMDTVQVRQSGGKKYMSRGNKLLKPLVNSKAKIFQHDSKDPEMRKGAEK